MFSSKRDDVEVRLMGDARKMEVGLTRYYCRILLLAAGVIFTCLSSSPARACDSCAAAIALPVTTGLLTAQIGLSTAAVIAAIGAAGGGGGFADSGVATSRFEAAKMGASMDFAGNMLAMHRRFRAENTQNMQSVNCRLATKNKMTPVLDGFTQAHAREMVRGLVDGVYFNPNVTPQRLAAGMIYRLCQNGQLAPSDLGKKVFDANNCIYDPTTVHDFEKVSTILDSPVLVPPLGTASGGMKKMQLLDNPELANIPPAPAANPLKAVWDSLNDKEKKYVGARRFCENLILNRVQPQTIRNDAAMTLGGMEAIAQNIGAMGSLSSAYDVCSRELSRRTAMDKAVIAGTSTEATPEKIISLLIGLGADARSLYAYQTAADYNDTTTETEIPVPDPAHPGQNLKMKIGKPISGAGKPIVFISQYLKDIYPREHALSEKCASYADTGTQSAKTGNMMACAQTAALFDRNEAADHKALMDAVVAIGQIPGAWKPDEAPVKAGYRPSAPGQPQLLHDAALDIPGFDQQPMRMDEMLQTMTAAEHPDKTAGIATAVQP